MDIYELVEEINGQIKEFDFVENTEELYVLYGKLFLQHCNEIPRFTVLKNGTILLDI